MWKIVGWANSKLDESVSDFHRAKIRQGEFKAVYSIWTLGNKRHGPSEGIHVGSISKIQTNKG